MSVMMWDSASQAFKEPTEVPKRFDAESGAWMETTGMAYDDAAGAWTERWSPNKILYLYNEGDECTDVTGGWVGNGTKGSNYMEANVYHGTSGWAAVGFCTNNIIDISDYSKMHIEMLVLSKTAYSGFVFGLSKTKEYSTNLEHDRSAISTEEQLSIFANTNNGEKITLSVDVSDIEEGYYVKSKAVSGGIGSVNGISWSGTMDFKIYKVWLE